MKKIAKNLLLLIVILFGLLICILIKAVEIPDSTINITYIGATGYLIESSNYKVFIEPTYGDIVKSFGYPYADSAIENDMLLGREIFDSIDLILISHVHAGHFDLGKTWQCIKSNPEATLITTSEVIESLKTNTENYEANKNRIYAPTSEPYEMFDTIIKGIPFTLTQIDHWGPTILLQYYFKLDGINIAFYLDYAKRNGKDHHVKTDSTDLGILDGAMFLDDDKRAIFGSDFDVKCAIFTHFTDFKLMDQKIEDNKTEFPNVGFWKSSMEKMSITKQNDSITIDTLNQCPVGIVEFANDTFLVNQPIDVQLPSEIFIDPDGDNFALTISQVNGSALPSWLTFDKTNMTLSGTTDQEQVMRVQFCATDPSHAWSTLNYNMVIKSTEPSTTILKTKSQNKDIIYPTVVDGVLSIDLSASKELVNTYAIFNLSGSKIAEGHLNPVTINRINIETLPAGTYLINLHACSGEYSYSFIKR